MDEPAEQVDWLRRIASGDRETLAEAFAEYRPRLRRMVDLRLDRRLKGRVDPSDVLQDAYLEISRRAPEYAVRPDMPFFLWLRLMTGQKLTETHRRHLSAQIRSVRREVPLPRFETPHVDSNSLAMQMLDSLTSASQAAIRAELRTALQEMLDRMDPLDREVLSLRHFEELCNSETAAVLGISKTAASNRYVRALKRLRQVLVDWPDLLN